MKRRPLRRGATGENLDSFLDIMTNTVGVLVFVLLFVTLAAADATVLVRTPLHQATSRTARLFEVRGDSLYLVDTRAASGSFQDFLERLPAVNWYTVDYVENRINNFTTATPNYRVDFVGSMRYGSYGLRYRLSKTAKGDASRTLRDSASHYLTVLSTLDPKEHYVAFLVRPDGFNAFREARKLAWARGLKVGWEPVEATDELIFGSGGRTIGTQ